MDLAHMMGSFAPAAPFVLVSMLGKCGDMKWVREIAATSRAHLDTVKLQYEPCTILSPVPGINSVTVWHSSQ